MILVFFFQVTIVGGVGPAFQSMGKEQTHINTHKLLLHYIQIKYNNNLICYGLSRNTVPREARPIHEPVSVTATQSGPLQTRLGPSSKQASRVLTKKGWLGHVHRAVGQARQALHAHVWIKVVKASNGNRRRYSGTRCHIIMGIEWPSAFETFLGCCKKPYYGIPFNTMGKTASSLFIINAQTFSFHILKHGH